MNKIIYHSLRFKASVLYSAILSVILVAFSSVMYWDMHAILFQDIDQELKIKAEEIAGILNAYDQMRRSEEHPFSQILELFKRRALGANKKMIIDEIWRSQVDALSLKEDYINILNLKGQTVLKSNNFNGDVAESFAKYFPPLKKDIVYKSVLSDRHRIRAINMPIQFGNFSLIIQVGTSQSSIEATLNRILMFMMGAIVVLLALTSFVGRVFIHHALKPVREVIELANTISHKDLNQRITEKKVDEEMKQLVHSFNSMIGRLSNSFNHINEFSSHAAHELKTPLAIMRGEIELALEENRPDQEYRDILEECLKEIDHMIHVIKDLLFLAKLDYKPEIFNFEKLSLIAFLDDIYGHCKILAETKGIDVQKHFPDKEIWIQADKVHLRRLFFNILSNAIKFTPRGGMIALRIYLQGSNCCVDIQDSGEGISEGALGKIFDKFFREPKDTNPSSQGTGLGLSIALSVAKAHGGNIQVKSVLNQGTTFTVFLPLL